MPATLNAATAAIRDLLAVIGGQIRLISGGPKRQAEESPLERWPWWATCPEAAREHAEPSLNLTAPLHHAHASPKRRPPAALSGSWP